MVVMLVAGCSLGSAGGSHTASDYQALRSSFVVPSGFTPATPAGPCRTDGHMQCWTTKALPKQAVQAAVQGLGSTYQTTDSSFCGPLHWAVQRKAWGEAHVPCMLRGTSHHLRVVVEAIAYPDRAASKAGHLVFPPTLVSVWATGS